MADGHKKMKKKRKEKWYIKIFPISTNIPEKNNIKDYYIQRNI